MPQEKPTASDVDPVTPAEVVRELVHRFAAGDWARAYSLYADDAEIWVEFNLPERFVTYGTKDWPTEPTRAYKNIEVDELTIHQTADPNVVVAEWCYLSRVGSSTVRHGNIIVAEVKEGKVVSSRDYHNHVARAIAEGTGKDLITKIESMILPLDRS